MLLAFRSGFVACLPICRKKFQQQVVHFEFSLSHEGVGAECFLSLLLFAESGFLTTTMDAREREGDGRGYSETDISKVCRNYLRGACVRAATCSFRHLNPGEIVAEVKSGNDLCRLIFCRDFQKSTCRRPNCRLLHATSEEEAMYRRTGKMPHRLLQVEALGGTLSGSQGYVQSMYASALAANTILPTATSLDNGSTEGTSSVAGAVGKRVQDLELEVKGLQSLNRSLLEENLTLKQKVSQLEEKLKLLEQDQKKSGRSW